MPKHHRFVMVLLLLAWGLPQNAQADCDADIINAMKTNYRATGVVECLEGRTRIRV